METVNSAGDSALLIAARLLIRSSGSLYSQAREMMTLLLQAAVDPDVRECQKRTALHLLAEFGDREVIKILVDSGAALDLQDVDGFTPMHLAALVGKSDAVEELLLSGANPEVENKIGLTAMHMTKDPQVHAVFQKFMRAVPVTRPKQQKMPEPNARSVIAMRRRNAAKQLEGESKIPSVFISFRVREVRKERLQ